MFLHFVLPRVRFDTEGFSTSDLVHPAIEKMKNRIEGLPVELSLNIPRTIKRKTLATDGKQNLQDKIEEKNEVERRFLQRPRPSSERLK